MESWSRCTGGVLVSVHFSWAVDRDEKLTYKARTGNGPLSRQTDIHGHDENYLLTTAVDREDTSGHTDSSVWTGDEIRNRVRS